MFKAVRLTTIAFFFRGLFSLCLSLCLSLFFSLGLSPTAQAQEAAPKLDAKPSMKDYTRFVQIGRRAQLQTSIVTLTNQAGVVVDLIGAIHIADKKYYDTLRKQFEIYDTLLYELVIGEEEDKREKLGAIAETSTLQGGMAKALDLSFQLEHIDYEADNFVHADMTADQFLASMKKRGESMFTMMMDAMRADLARQGEGRGDAPSINELIKLMDGKHRTMQLKMLMAKQFADADEMIEMMEGKDGSVILTERNKVALKVLRKTMKKGVKHIGIFYGAAHLPDMEERLVKRKGFHRSEVKWLSAWNMYKP